MKSRGRSIILRLLASIFFIAFMYHWHLMYDFFYYPRVPDASSGHVVAYMVKGVSVYITSSENRILYALLFVEIFVGIPALFLLFKEKYSKK